MLDEKKSNISDHEFVSDTLQSTTQDLVEVKEGMKKLGLGMKNGKFSFTSFFFFAFY